MELLIPGLILVALMAWASTKIKKSASDAFEEETVETDEYRLRKPDGFLHVIGAKDHDFSAYSREFGVDENEKVRRATIEIDKLPMDQFEAARNEVVNAASDSEVIVSNNDICEIRANEAANRTDLTTFYKFVRNEKSLFRLRFAMIAESKDAFLEKVRPTLDSFELK